MRVSATGTCALGTMVTQGCDGRVPGLLAASKDAHCLMHRSGRSPWSVDATAVLNPVD